MQDPENKIISLLQNLPATGGVEDALTSQLGELLNELIQQDFGAVVQLLYRADVPEKEVRLQLQQGHEDAGRLLAPLLVRRQKEKAILRQQFRSTPPADGDEERW